MFKKRNQVIALVSVLIVILTFVLIKDRDLLVENKGIIFIPGFLGSEIHSVAPTSSKDYLKENFITTSYPTNYRFWPPASVTGSYGGIKDLINKKRIQTDASMLLCDFNGRPIVPTMAMDLDKSDDLYGTANYYGPVMNNLKNTFKDNNIDYFDYDWRLSTKDAATRLEAFIDEKGYEEVILIGYSMGGLIASLYIANSPNNSQKVKKLITIGTPYLGTPKAIYALATGKMLDFYKNLVMATPLKGLFTNFVSSYELLPTEKYFLLNNTSYIQTYQKKSGWFSDDEKIAEVSNYLDSANIINSIWGANRPFIDDAKNIHDHLFLADGSHVTSLVDSYYIIGYGVDTIEKVEIQYDASGNYESVVDINSSLQGDGSVPIMSASIGATTPIDKTFYINEKHNDLITNQEVIELVDMIIKNEPTVERSIAHNKNAQKHLMADRSSKKATNSSLWSLFAR